jgi:hypothetical protein
MTVEKKKVQTRNFPFPSSPEDGTVVFHQDMVCQYYASSNTWACSRLTDYQ